MGTVLMAVAGGLSAVVLWQYLSRGPRQGLDHASGSARVTSPWMVVEAWRNDELVLRTLAQPTRALTLPLAPLLTGAARSNDDAIRITADGVLEPLIAAGTPTEGLPWDAITPGQFELQLHPLRVRVSGHDERPVIERVAPLATPRLYPTPERCPGEPNPFTALHQQWLDTHGSADDEDVYPLFPHTSDALPPVQHGQTEADLFSIAAEESVLGSLDDGLPGVGDLDDDALLPLGNDGTGDGLVGALTPAGGLACYWIGHDPPGIFFRGPSLLLLLERLTQEQEVEATVSAWGALDEAGTRAVPVPPCYVSGSNDLETKLDAQPQDRLVLDFRGKPAGHAYENPQGFPVALLDGLVMVLQT